MQQHGPWEFIDWQRNDGADVCTERLFVPGGWILRSLAVTGELALYESVYGPRSHSSHRRNPSGHTTMIFISDPEHKWTIVERK